MGSKRRLADIPMPPADQRFLTRLEACRVGRVGTSTFDKAVADKRIKVRWNGTHIIVERAEIIRFVESLPTERPLLDGPSSRPSKKRLKATKSENLPK